MPLRFSGAVPELFYKRWEDAREDLQAFLRKLSGGVNGLQGTPSDPSTIEAGATADPGDSQSPSPSDHTHSVLTAAPANKVAFTGSPTEGAGNALMRASALNVLADGGAAGDVLIWNGSTWVSTSLADSVEDSSILTWLNL